MPILGEPLLDSTLRVDPHVYKRSTITITNSLAYYDMQLLTAVMKFMVLAPGPNVKILFSSVIYECSYEASVFAPGEPFRPYPIFLQLGFSLMDPSGLMGSLVALSSNRVSPVEY